MRYEEDFINIVVLASFVVAIADVRIVLAFNNILTMKLLDTHLAVPIACLHAFALL